MRLKGREAFHPFSWLEPMVANAHASRGCSTLAASDFISAPLETLLAEQIFYFEGNVRAKVTPCSTQKAKLSFVLWPSAETITQPFIGFPVMSNCLVLGNFNESLYFCGPTRTMRSSFKMPQTMFPRIRKQTPPNIFFSLRPGLAFRRALTLSASPLSYPIHINLSHLVANIYS